MRRSGLRFAMITTFYPPCSFGGDANFVRQLSEALVRRGHEVEVIHDRDAFTALGGQAQAKPAALPGLNVHGMESHWPKLACLATQQTARPLVHGRKIRQILADRKPDVIHFHNVSLIGGAGLLTAGEGIRLYTAHEHWLVCPTHTLWRNNEELCDEPRCTRCVLRYRRPPQFWRKSGYLERQAEGIDQFCSPSEFSARMHRRMGFGPKMEVLPLFLPDTESPEDPPPPGEYQGKPYFLFAGRLEKIKGVQDLIPTFRKHPGAELWIAGAGSYEPVLRKLAGDSINIRFLGQRDSQELRSLYAHATAVLMPSLCYEVFPMVVLEALREGVPIIARDLGPYPEIVRDSGGGLLFASEDGLRDAVERMISDAPAREAMGRSGRKCYLERWSEPAGMQAYFSLIRKIAARRGEDRLLEVLENCDEFGQPA